MPAFADLRTFMKLPHAKDLTGAELAVIGVPFDTGASYRVGARFGPAAIRAASAGLRPFHPAHRTFPLQALHCCDYGDLAVYPGWAPKTVEALTQQLRDVLADGCTPVFLGGDHSVSFPLLRGVAARHGPLALVHFDAHTDTWDTQAGEALGHGTPFRRALDERLIDTARSIQIGLRGPVITADDPDLPRRLGFAVLEMEEAAGLDAAAIAARIRARVGSGPVYLSFDIDCVDPAFAPGTGTPEVGGFTSREVLAILRRLGGLRFAGFDLVEVLPAFDPAQVTSVLAANLVFEFIALAALGRAYG